MRPAEAFRERKAELVRSYAEMLDRLERAMEGFSLEEPKTYVYAASDGEVVLEWDVGGWKVSLEISVYSDFLSAAFHALNMKTDEVEGRGLHMHRKESWEWLEGWLRKKAQEAR